MDTTKNHALWQMVCPIQNGYASIMAYLHPNIEVKKDSIKRASKNNKGVMQTKE